jgi:hypothetical protein
MRWSTVVDHRILRTEGASVNDNGRLLAAETVSDEGCRRSNVDVDIGVAIVTEEQKIDGEKCQDNENDNRDDGDGVDAAPATVATRIDVNL